MYTTCTFNIVFNYQLVMCSVGVKCTTAVDCPNKSTDIALFAFRFEFRTLLLVCNLNLAQTKFGNR